MSDKDNGLYKKYDVKKLSNPNKFVDCMVLEFDDPVARVGLAAYAEAAHNAGYKTLAADIRGKLYMERER